MTPNNDGHMSSKLDFPNRKFNLIYCDSPWSYHLYRPQFSYKGDVPSPLRTAASFYKTMTINEICSLPVRSIAANNCALFLWATNPTLDDAFKVIRAWGFEFKTVAFYWTKKCKYSNNLKIGMGHYTRPSCEPLLLAMNGTLKVLDHSIRQVVVTTIEQHSKKPAIFRDLIIRLFGDLPKIELFAREEAEGWSSWGDELHSPNSD